jgi:hypothetical protein
LAGGVIASLTTTILPRQPHDGNDRSIGKKAEAEIASLSENFASRVCVLPANFNRSFRLIFKSISKTHER